MSITEALIRAHSLLQSCAIPMQDAAVAGEAMQLIAASIDALRSPVPTDKKEESK